MAVESWGKGNPDFYTITQPTKSFVSNLIQERWNLSLEATLPGGYDTGIVDAYTVPVGKQLNVTFWKASAAQSAIFYGYFFNTGTFYGRVTCDVFESGSTGETGAYVFDAGEIFQYRMVNTVVVPASVAFRFAGTLTTVA